MMSVVVGILLVVGVVSACAQGQSVVCWGDNSHGQCTVPTDLGPTIAIAGGHVHTIALVTDGTVRCWGGNSFGQCTAPADLGPVAAIAGGGFHTIALRTDGTVQCWGHNGYGQCTVPVDLGPVTAIAGGGLHTIALCMDGTVRCWGENGSGQCAVPADLGPAIAVAGRAAHTIALGMDGRVRCWGSNTDGQCTVPLDLGPATKVAGGYGHTIALRSDGMTRCWGSDVYGQCTVPADLGPATAAAGGWLHTVALRMDGGVRCWGSNGAGQCTVPADLGPVVAVAAGSLHTIALSGVPNIFTITLSSATTNLQAGDVFTVRASNNRPAVPVSGAQIVLSFDALRLRLEAVTPVGTGALGVELSEQIDNSAGTLRYALGLSNQSVPLEHAADLCDLVFSVLPEAIECASEEFIAFDSIGGISTRFTRYSDAHAIVPALASLPRLNINSTAYYVDADIDGFGSNTAEAIRSCSAVAGSVTNNSDCNDALVTYVDGDGDGVGAGSPAACGVATGNDCNDANNSIFPGAMENCANLGVNNDCDGDNSAAEAVDATNYYVDADNDGFGSSTAAAVRSCAVVAGSVTNNSDCNDALVTYADGDNDGVGAGSAVACGVASNTDCDDTSATAFPGATELCNGVDDDCDAAIDDAVGVVSFYRDQDGDGFGNAAVSVQNCTGVAPEGYGANSSDCDDTRLLYADTDGDGFGAGAAVACGVATKTDCDPARATAYPGAAELCNGLDDDCDAAADDGLTFSNYYTDADSDGFGATGSTPVSACAPVSGRVLGDSSDCDDSRASVYPGAVETCNQRDDDCDAQVDEGLATVSYFPDADGDTYGFDSATAERSCAPIAGKVANNLDCDDARATAYFGALELCNGLDDDCDSAADNGLTFLDYYTDSDGDSYGVSTGTGQNSCNPVTGKVPNNLDCNDTNPAISPDATETCNGIDDSCTGGIDDGLTFLNYYSDADADTYGAANGVEQSSCNPVSGKVTNNLDCNDGNAAIRPGATETCNGVDDDCDAAIDDGLTFTTFYRDADGDGFGTSATTVENCTGIAPTGYVATGGDCDDIRVLYADVDVDGLGVGSPAACGAPVAGDNCPTVSNADQANCDGDADGNACDANDDNDIALDINDAYPCVAGQYRLDSAFSASQITAFLATATAATVDATGMDATQLAAIVAGAEGLAPNGIIGTFTITAALSDLEIHAILGNIAASFGGGGPTVTVDGSAITGPPAYPEMDADQLGAVADNIGVVNSVDDVTLTADIDPAAIASIVGIAPNGEATIDATGMDASQILASVSGASIVVIEGEVLLDSGVTGTAFTEVLSQLSSPASGTTVQFDTTGLSTTEQAAVNAAINTQLAGSYCSIADADFDTYYTSACLVQYTDCADNNPAVNPGNLPVLAGVPASFTVPADAGTTAGAMFANPVTASDTCEGDLTSSVVVSVAHPVHGSSTGWPAGDMFAVGVSTVTWTVTDALGNIATATRTIEVLNYQLLDATVALTGFLAGPTTRPIRLIVGGSSAVVNLSFASGLNPSAAIVDMQVPVAAGYACIAAKDTTHSITDAAAPAVVSGQYAASFVLRQGDANNDDMVDIFDYAAFINARGVGRASDASSNYNGDTDINTFDFSFISAAFLATGESCSASFNPPAPRTRVSVKDLRRAGLGDLAIADLNHDGWVDTRDIQLFMQSGGGANGGLDAPTGEPARRW
jgi:hypothetical protein